MPREPASRTDHARCPTKVGRVASPLVRVGFSSLASDVKRQRCSRRGACAGVDAELEAMGIVDDPVEDGEVMPAIDRNLAGDQDAAAAVAVFDKLEDENGVP